MKKIVLILATAFMLFASNEKAISAPSSFD
jgi:hypothetical protein